MRWNGTGRMVDRGKFELLLKFYKEDLAETLRDIASSYHEEGVRNQDLHWGDE